MLMSLLVGLLAMAPAPEDPAPVEVGRVLEDGPGEEASTEAPASTGAASEAQTREQPAPQPVRQDVEFRWRDHPQVRSGRLFRVDFQAKFQWDARDPGDDPPDFDEYEIHRMRVGIEGELFNHYQFSVERELTENETGTDNTSTTPRKSAWKDVYLEVNYTDAAQVRFGKYKIPFGLEQLTGIANLDFVYRSLSANYLAPGRDIGLMVHGRFFGRGLNYWAGVFKQDGENARSSSIVGADTTVAVRVTGTPFRRVKAAGLDDLEVGGAFTVSSLDDESTTPNGLRGRTVMSQFVFFEPVFVKGQRRRYEVDGDWSAGPVGARAEFTYTVDTRDNQGLADQDLPDARARGWYVSGAWVLTGERKERPVVPKRAFGAIEAVARYDKLWFDSTPSGEPELRNPRAEFILPNADRVLSLGINWYITRWVKLQLQTIREELEDPERSPVPGAFWSPVFRFQVGI
jgi:phosphate-selective porin OprO/OprP